MSRREGREHWLYVSVLVAAVLGVVVGLLAPDLAVQLKPLGTAFVSLVTMMVSPIIFCTVVVGVATMRQASAVGRIAGISLAYFLVMTVVALTIGLVVGNVLHPGQGLVVTTPAASPEPGKGAGDLLMKVIPTSLFAPVVGDSTLQTLFVALLVGFGILALGDAGEPVVRVVKVVERLVFAILSIVMWASPIGVFGALAAVVGGSGTTALLGLGQLMLTFYLTCALFILLLLVPLLRLVTGLGPVAFARYLGREVLLVLATSSSEVVLPRLIAKMEHLGVHRSVAGITVPLGYSFNLDGLMIYLTMASLFIADVSGNPMSMSDQVSLLLFMMVASKGAAAVSGAGLATLTAGLRDHRPDLVDGVGLIAGIDRFMSEARSLTNFAGNAVATVVVAAWTGLLDRDQARRVLAGEFPFDERRMLDPEPSDAPRP